MLRQIKKLKMCLKSPSISRLEKTLAGFGIKLGGRMRGFLKKLNW